MSMMTFCSQSAAAIEQKTVLQWLGLGYEMENDYLNSAYWAIENHSMARLPKINMTSANDYERTGL